MSARDAGMGEARIPAEMLEALMPQLKEMGFNVGDVARAVPRVRIDDPIRDLAIKMGGLLKGSGLFRFGPEERLIYFCAGKRQAMSQLKFCSWVERHVEVVKVAGRGQEAYDVKVSMGKDLAAKLLEADELRQELPLIEQVVSTRIPVRRKDGRVELCAVGHDAEARLYCTQEVPFEDDWSLQQGMDYLAGLCSDFPWADRGKGDVALWSNRSYLVHVSAMLGMFVRRLMPAGTMRPLVIYLANEQGSGKSLLVSMLLAAGFGMGASTDLPMGGKGLNQEKFTALLETVAQSMREYLWLDDVPGAVFSNALNRFVTAPSHTGRKYGGNDEMFEVANVTQVFMTGNNVELTRDIMQRALVAELFLEVDSQSRSFGRKLTPNWLAEPAQRAALNSALWAITRHWIEAGMPRASMTHGRAGDWSELVGGILESLGVTANAFAAPELPMAGDRETEEWRRLLQLLADAAEEMPETFLEPGQRFEVDTERLVSVAREHKLLADLVGVVDDKPLKGGELKRLGKRLAKWRGREDLLSSSGRRFRFGKRKQSSNWVYPIEWLDEEQPANG
jgi:hypothetical protein